MKRKLPKHKGVRVSKPTSFVPETPPQSVEEFEKWIVQNAVHFTCVYKKGPGKMQREEYETLAEAVKARGDNPCRMVYAVTESGRAAMIAPWQYSVMLALSEKSNG